MSEEKRKGRPARKIACLRIVVKNNRPMDTYVRLLDPEWEGKEHLTIQSGEMEDPTIGKLHDLHEQLSDLLSTQPGEILKVHGLYLWSPALPAHADSFTLHLYDDTGKERFDNLLVLFLVPTPEQVRPDWIWWEGLELEITSRSRIAFTMPAYSEMLLDLLYYIKA